MTWLILTAGAVVAGALGGWTGYRRWKREDKIWASVHEIVDRHIERENQRWEDFYGDVTIGPKDAPTVHVTPEMLRNSGGITIIDLADDE